MVTGLLVLLLSAAVAGAGSALAIDDPTRPDARVTHGPSCHPGGIVVEVVAGSAPFSVRLATTRRPAGEDEATLGAQGSSVVLRTGDVAPGETIDPRLEFTARDGSGVAYVDELEEYTLTRPTVEDCQLALSPPPPPPAPPTASVEAGATAPAPSTGSAGGTGSQAGVAVTTSRAPRTTTTSSETSTTGTPSVTSVPESTSPAVPAPAAAGTPQIPSGGTVTLRGAGFIPGERVDIRLHGRDTVLATATADADGAVRVDVRIPADVTAGPTTLDLVGVDSAVSTGVDLQVAAGQEAAGRTRGVVSLASLIAAAVALVGTVGALVSVAGRQHADRRGRGPIRTA
ncbi:conserved exported protein of unknown function [Blastococcus saxobsidens DD2]|uniref:IPT/TIG domain-containing protein n=1 Tax=Blastococcus saxobsidens (strain DD2) TaxID=1146883 RepID=H6RN47_BLASD|nr:conserved exported protein of unknown function [Blastococcus saxobsidens DD2]